MVERYLADCPLISQVAVIGTPHERYVEQVTAVVVPRDPSATPELIEAYCRDHPELRGIQRPRRLELVAAMPLTGSGKVDRTLLARRFAEG